jgi:hypothetical protein
MNQLGALAESHQVLSWYVALLMEEAQQLKAKGVCR